jgi:hypothetical protein
MLDSSWLLLPIGSCWLLDYRKQSDTLSAILITKLPSPRGTVMRCVRTLNSNIDVRASQALMARKEVKASRLIA